MCNLDPAIKAEARYRKLRRINTGLDTPLLCCHDISALETECPACSGKLKPLSESISEQLDTISTAFRVWADVTYI